MFFSAMGHHIRECNCFQCDEPPILELIVTHNTMEPPYPGIARIFTAMSSRHLQQFQCNLPPPNPGICGTFGAQLSWFTFPISFSKRASCFQICSVSNKSFCFGLLCILVPFCSHIQVLLHSYFGEPFLSQEMTIISRLLPRDIRLKLT